jgi:hypothetical protein
MISLEGTRVEADVTLGELTVAGPAIMERMRVGGALTFVAFIGYMQLSLEQTEIGGDVSFDRCEVRTPIRASAIQVDGSFFLGDAKLAGLTLAGAKVTRDLSMTGSIPVGVPNWREGATLDLRNATVGALAIPDFIPKDAIEDPWPSKLDLRGFSFSKLVVFGLFVTDRSAQRADELVKWLARDESGSTQPYTQFAKVLLDAGELEKANAILFAGRERARNMARTEKSLGR